MSYVSPNGFADHLDNTLIRMVKEKEGNQAVNGQVAHTFSVIKISFSKRKKIHIKRMLL